MNGAGEFTIQEAIAQVDARLSVYSRKPTEDSLKTQLERCASIPPIGMTGDGLSSYAEGTGSLGTRADQYAIRLDRCMARYYELEIQHQPIHSIAEKAVRGILTGGQTTITRDQLDTAISNAIATYEASISTTVTRDEAARRVAFALSNAFEFPFAVNEDLFCNHRADTCIVTAVEFDGTEPLEAHERSKNARNPAFHAKKAACLATFDNFRPQIDAAQSIAARSITTADQNGSGVTADELQAATLDAVRTFNGQMRANVSGVKMDAAVNRAMEVLNSSGMGVFPISRPERISLDREICICTHGRCAYGPNK